MNQTERFRRLSCNQEVRDNLRARSVRAAAFTGLAGALEFVIRLGSTAVLARLILPEHFGLVMMVMAVAAIGDQFRDLGLSSATVQRPEISLEEVTNLFWINVLCGLSIAAVLCAGAPLIAAYYQEPRLTVIALVLSSNFIFGGLMVQHQALLTRKLQLGHTATIRLLSSLLSTLLAVLLAWLGYGYWALVWREVSRSVLLTTGIWLCLPWVPGRPFGGTSVRGLVYFGADITAANIFTVLSTSADRFLIGRYWGASPVAFYRQAYQLLVLPMEQVLTPLFQVTQPALSMLQTDPASYRRFYYKVLALVCLASMPLSVFAAVYSGEITAFILGKEWVASSTVILILSLGTFIRAPVSWSGHVLVSLGRTRTFLVLNLIQNVVTVVVMSIGVRWGMAGVAIADVACTYLLMAPRLYFSFKSSPITIASFFATTARPVIASAGLAGALIWLRSETGLSSLPTSLGLGALVALMVFLGVWIVIPGGKAELLSLASDLRSIWKQKSASSTTADSVAVAG